MSEYASQPRQVSGQLKPEGPADELRESTEMKTASRDPASTRMEG